jgi:chromosome segregation ATPase
MNADHPADWLHPFQVRAVIQYAKDLFLNGDREKSRALLSAYREALNPADEATGWPAALQPWRDELHELAAEVNMLLGRLEDSLDFFGNPVGWAPVLSLKSNLMIYDAEIDDAIKQLWFAYRVRTAFDRVQDATTALQDAVGALDAGRKNLEGTLTQAQNSVPGLLTSLQDKATTYAREKSRLMERQDKLLGEAKSKEERQRIIKGVFGVIDAASTIVPVGQPYLKAAGSAVNNISQFFTDDPEDRSNALEGLGKTAGALKTDLGTYQTSLIQNVSDGFVQIETESAKLGELTDERDAALAQVEAKSGLYKAIREARAAVNTKEDAIDKLEGEIAGLKAKKEIATRTRPPAPKPGATDSDEDKALRAACDKAITEADTELTTKGTALATAKKDLPPLKLAVDDKTTALARSEDHYEYSASARSAKTALASQKRELTRKKAEKSAQIEQWQRALGNASEGLGKLANSGKQFTLPADQVAARVNAELVKLEKNDPLYKELKETVDDMELEVTDLKQSLQSTRSVVDTTTRNWLDNRGQTRALSATIQRKSRVLDHFALQYVDKMKADAYERLIRYQYYIQKSFEYLFLTPCPMSIIG